MPVSQRPPGPVSAAPAPDERVAALCDFGRLYERVRAAGAAGVAGLTRDADDLAAAPGLSAADRERLEALRTLLHAEGPGWSGPAWPAAHLRLVGSAWAARDDLPGIGLREWLVTTGPDGPWLRCLDGASGAPRLPFAGHGPGPIAVAADPAGAWIVSACTLSLRAWRLADGRCAWVRSRPVDRARSSGVQLRVRPGRPQALWTRGCHFQLWDVATGTLVTEYDSPAMAKWLWFLEGGDRILVADTGGGLVLDAESGRCLTRWDWWDAVSAVHPLDGGRRVVGVNAMARYAYTHDVATGRWLRELPGPLSESWRIHPAPDGRRVVALWRDGGRYGVRIWDWETGRVLATTGTLSGDPGLTAAFAPDGESLWFGLRKVDLTAGTWTSWGKLEPAEPVGFLPDGVRLAGLLHGTVVVDDVRTGERVAICGDGFDGATVLPDGRIAASGRGAVALWDPSAQPRLVARPWLDPDGGPATGEVLVRYADGRQLELACDRQETRCLGDTEVTESSHLVLRSGPNGSVLRTAPFSPALRLATDGRHAVTPVCGPFGDERGVRVVSVGSWSTVGAWELMAETVRATCAGERIELATRDGRVLRFEVMPAGPWPEARG